ncbi:hypothetical protein J3P88_12930 [Pseudomonas sp. Z3-6]
MGATPCALFRRLHSCRRDPDRHREAAGDLQTIDIADPHIDYAGSAPPTPDRVASSHPEPAQLLTVFTHDRHDAAAACSTASVIAVQRGIVCVAIGTDTAGSIRVPAAFNGLTGFKGSSHRYDMSGIHPLAVTFDSLGCLQQSVLGIGQ